ADLVPDADVGRGARTRRLADRRLVDFEHAADALPAVDARDARERGLAAATRRDEPRDVVVQHVAHERALAAARDARDTNEALERNRDVEARDVVPLDTLEREPCALPGHDVAVRHERMPRRRRERAARDGILRAHEIVERAARDDLAAEPARARSQV